QKGGEDLRLSFLRRGVVQHGDRSPCRRRQVEACQRHEGHPPLFRWAAAASHLVAGVTALLVAECGEAVESSLTQPGPYLGVLGHLEPAWAGPPQPPRCRRPSRRWREWCRLPTSAAP